MLSGPVIDLIHVNSKWKVLGTHGTNLISDFGSGKVTDLENIIGYVNCLKVPQMKIIFILSSLDSALCINRNIFIPISNNLNGSS